MDVFSESWGMFMTVIYSLCTWSCMSKFYCTFMTTRYTDLSGVFTWLVVLCHTGLCPWKLEGGRPMMFHLLCHFSIYFYLCFWKYFEEMAIWSCVISSDICRYIQVCSSFVLRNRDETLHNFSWKFITPTSKCKSGTKTKHGHTVCRTCVESLRQSK